MHQRRPLRRLKHFVCIIFIVATLSHNFHINSSSCQVMVMETGGTATPSPIPTAAARPAPSFRDLNRGMVGTNGLQFLNDFIQQLLLARTGDRGVHRHMQCRDKQTTAHTPKMWICNFFHRFESGCGGQH